MTLKTKKVLAGSLSLALLAIFIVPAIASALDYTPLIQCGTATTHECKFADAIGTINRIINWIISIAGVIFTISFIYGGFLLIISCENPGNKEKAKDVLWSTLKGFVIILISWLIVYTILISLVPDKNSLIFKFIK